MANQTKMLTILLAAFASALLLFSLLLGSDSASAQQPNTPTPAPFPTPTGDQEASVSVQDLPPLQGKTNPPKRRKLDSNLNRIAEQVQQRLLTENQTLSPKDEWVGVTIYLNKNRLTRVKARLEKRGITPRNVGVDYIEVHVPPELLNATSKLQGVINIRTTERLRPAQGTSVSPAVGLHGADGWHDAAMSGQGVKIGVIDLGFHKISESFMKEELPEVMYGRCIVPGSGEVVYSDNKDSSQFLNCSNNHQEHGTAVTEAIFEIAPEATYYLATAYTLGDVAAATDWMIDNEVDESICPWALHRTVQATEHPLTATAHSIQSKRLWKMASFGSTPLEMRIRGTPGMESSSIRMVTASSK